MSSRSREHRRRSTGKAGSTMVEAAMVLPLLMLSILSMILLVMYFYASLDAQLETQDRVIEKGLDSRAVFRILKEDEETSVHMRGLVKKMMSRQYVTRHYVFNMGEAIRLGRNFAEDE